MNGSSSNATGLYPAMPTDTLAEGARALKALPATSASAATGAILEITCRHLPAFSASFWRYDKSGRLRLLGRAGNKDIARTGNTGTAVREVGWAALFADNRPRLHSPVKHSALAETLQYSARTQSALTLPVTTFGTSQGLLCVEFLESRTTVGTETELFLQLAAARIEAAFLAETPCTDDDTRQVTGPYPLQQSHLVLSDESLRDLFYLAPTAMMLAGIDDPRPLAVNQHALALFRISTERSDTLLATELWEDEAERRQFIGEALAHGHVREHRVRLRRADGTVFWGLVSATLIDHDGQRALMNSISDVSDTVAAEEILNRTRQTLTTLLEASPYPLIVTRLDNGEIRYCNQKAADMFETPLSGLLGHTAPEFYVDPSDRRYFVEKLRTIGKIEGFVTELKTPGGQPFWSMLSAKTLELNGEPVFMVAFADVTRQKRKEEELENLAFRDALTNAYNRRYFVEAAQAELARAERNCRLPALTLIDIDHFKQLNDTFGHEVGDNVLREFVALVQSMLRKTDILARYGGEEFAIVFPETSLDAAKDIVERICTTIAAHRFPTGATASTVTFSAGIVEARAGEEYPALVARADDLLYEAKHAGRNHVRSG